MSNQSWFDPPQFSPNEYNSKPQFPPQFNLQMPQNDNLLNYKPPQNTAQFNSTMPQNNFNQQPQFNQQQNASVPPTGIYPNLPNFATNQPTSQPTTFAQMNSTPTLRPYPNFNPSEDSKRLYKAMKVNNQKSQLVQKLLNILWIFYRVSVLMKPL